MAGNGGISPGYVFSPSEQLLLDFYLRKKVDGQEADDQVLGTIPTVDLFGRDASPPWLLHPAAVAPTSSKKKSSYCSRGIVPRKVTDWFYCFARTNRRGPGSCRTTNCGTWLTSGGDKRVTTESDDDDDDEGGEEGVVTTLGYKCTLAFKLPAGGGSCGGGSKWVPTSWVMHEFKLHRGHHPDVIRRMEEAAATKKIDCYKNKGGSLFVREESAADQLVLCRIRCTKVPVKRPGCALKSGLGSPAGEEPPQKRQRPVGCRSVGGDHSALMEVVIGSEGELGGQASPAVGSSSPSDLVALDHVELIVMTEGEGPPQQAQVVTPGATGLDVELIIVRTEEEGCNHNVPWVQQQQHVVAAPAATLDDPTEGEEGFSQKNPPQQQVVTPGAGDLDVQELILRTEGEGCSSHNVPDPQQQQVAVTPGAGLDSAAAVPPFPCEGGIADDEYCWMSDAAPNDEMWGMLLAFLNE